MNKPNEIRILTLHPHGKKGVNISKAKYDQIKEFILKCLSGKKEIIFGKLTDLAVDKLIGKYDGKIPWYVVTVKLDLEARNIIERIPKTRPQKLRLKK